MEAINKKSRDYYFDNLRFILILTVVLGHIISPLGKITSIKFIYRYLYIFHMPAMIFISGYFSKTSIKDGKLVKNKIFNYILLYAIFQLLYTIINEGRFSIYQSQMGLWYIQILILYMMIMPILTRLKAKYVFLLSIILGIIVGIDTSAGHVGSLSRVLVFLPFFVAGYYCKREYLEKFFKIKYIVVGIIILIFVGVLLYIYMGEMSWLLDLVSGKSSYKSMGLSNFQGIISRVVYYIIVSLVCLSIMTITPKGKTFFSKFGGRTLQVFCLHLILVVLLRKTELYQMLLQQEPVNAVFIVLLIGVGATFLLSLKIFSYPFDFIMNCKFNHILEQESVKTKSDETNKVLSK